MPRRSRVSLCDVASWDNLSYAFWRAAKGKREHHEVRRFEEHLDARIREMQQALLTGAYEFSPFHRFEIRDPKPRIIHAPVFEDRVVHHALVAQIGPVLERCLVFDTYACRVHKGTLAAVLRAQKYTRKFKWYVKTDIRQYFASICHDIAGDQLQSKFKDPGILALCHQVLETFHTQPGRGLPIGALTSQYFANFYLNSLDRLLLERIRVGGMVRYMDDVVWWGDDRLALRQSLEEVRVYLSEALRLELKPNWQLQQTRCGLSFCGFRVFPDRLVLTPRKRKRYYLARQRLERAFRLGIIDSASLQSGYDAALATTGHADAANWRRQELERRPPLDG
jgi:RNA-directed DNA polymerase